MNDLISLQDIDATFENADLILKKRYISELSKMPIIVPAERITNVEIGSNVVLYHVDKLGYDNKENVHYK